MRKTILRQIGYVFVILAVLLGLAIIYHNADIEYPLLFVNGDNMGVFYYVKMIKNFGWNLVNPMMGGLNGTTMYDYLYSDKWSFGLVWLLSLFSDNFYLITNVFYFCSYILAAVCAFYVCRKLGLQDCLAGVVAVLYAFSPYMLQRYGHMWLTPYYFMPLAVLAAVWMIEGELLVEGKVWWKNRRIWGVVVISFLCSQTGLYYAFFTCVLYAITAFVVAVNAEGRGIMKRIYPIFFCIPVITGVAMNIIPNLLYWQRFGYNASNEMALRGPEGSELSGLKFIQMILPRAFHRIGVLADLTQYYNSRYPLVNENGTASLGIVAAVGFIISVAWLFCRTCKAQRDRTLSYLNIGLFMVGTIGGVGSLFSLLVKLPMRCYNRICVLIMFVSLLVTASCLQRMATALNKWIYYGLLLAVLCIGFFDQTTTYQPAYDYAQIDNLETYVGKIEDSLNEGDAVFQLPYVPCPTGGNYRMFYGYLHSDTLRWSYGSMQGREEANWQQSVAEYPTEQMLQEIRESGYAGVYLDIVPYVQIYGEEVMQARIVEITEHLGQPLVNDYGELYFWKLDQ